MILNKHDLLCSAGRLGAQKHQLNQPVFANVHDRFGKSEQDDTSCLAPMLQCCMIRVSTLQRLARLYAGPQPLSAIMGAALSKDQVSPVLLQAHLRALDRRLVKILQALAQCAEEEGRTLRDVIVEDGVY